MMKPSLQLRIGQQLTMTPQLQQAIRLLQMPVLELNTSLREALEKNVMLELEEQAESNSESSVEAGDFTNTVWDLSTGGPSRATEWSGDGNQANDIEDHSGETLRDHLLWQVELEHFLPREAVLAVAIIDSLDEAGYLIDTMDAIYEGLDRQPGFTPAELEAALIRVQSLDPAGVGARDLSECLAIQLGQLDTTTPGRDLAVQVVDGHLDLVADQAYDELRRQLGVSDEALDTAVALVRSCHPRPGNVIQSEQADYIIPDVVVRHDDGRWLVDVNRSIAPRLRVNQAYADMLRGKTTHATLKAQLQEARWLVRSLEIRHDTLLRVAMCIVDRQKDFLEHGEEAMRPMVLRDVAEAVDMHESTISRVTANKYMHTPRGVFEFRYFFSSHLAGDGGEEKSSTAIRARIRRLIGQEDPGKPLSDSKIAAHLKDEGVAVARRTVAKYREAMRIAPSSERRRMAAR
jgi:RNA polymerase sigma-54 factor